MPDPKPDRRVGKYRVEDEIGRGGMARVFRAVDTTLQRTVALKILAPQMSADPEWIRRFDREAITAANLRHPAIITIYEVGQAGTLHFIAMEYIAGRTLAEVVREQGRLSLPLTVALLQPVAEALSYAHTLHAIHRDVKPQNIMLDRDGRVLLTDFGIAIRPTASPDKLTQNGLLMATPEYMSPEQAQGSEVDGQSDQYGLAVVAFELLTGRLPFTGTIPQLIVAHVYSPPPRITGLNGQLPPELDRHFARALAKTPQARFGSPVEFIAGLRSSCQHGDAAPIEPAALGALATPASSAGQATVMLQSHATVLTEPIASTIGSSTETDQQPPPIIAAVFGSPPGNDAPPPPHPAPAAAARPQAGAAVSEPIIAIFGPQQPSGHDQSRSTAAPAQLPPTRSPRDIDPRYRLPRRSSPRPYMDRPLPWRTIVVVVVLVVIIGISLFQSHHGIKATGETPAPSSGLSSLFGRTSEPGANGETVLAPSPSPLVDAHGASTGAADPIAIEDQRVATGQPGPDVLASQHLAVDPTLLARLFSATPMAVATTVAKRGTPSSATPTPIGGGRYLASEVGADLRLQNIQANKTITIKQDARSLGPVSFSPDARSILFDALQGQTHRILRYEIEGGTTRALLPSAPADLYHPAWSPGGQTVVFVMVTGGSPHLFIVDADGSSSPVALLPDVVADDPAWRADGQQLAFAVTEVAGKHAIYLLDRQGVHRFSPSDRHANDRDPAFSPDGSALTYTSDRNRDDGGSDIYVQALDGGPANRLTDLTIGTSAGPHWSPDGQLLAFWSSAAGKQTIYAVRPDGSHLTNLSATIGDDARWPVWSK